MCFIWLKPIHTHVYDVTPLYQALDLGQNIQHAALVFVSGRWSTCGLPGGQNGGQTLHAPFSLWSQTPKTGLASHVRVLLRHVCPQIIAERPFFSCSALVMYSARRVSAVNTRMCLSREQSAPRHKDSAYSYMNCSLTFFFFSRINRSVQTWSGGETPKHNITRSQNRGGAFLNTLNMTNVYLFSFSEWMKGDQVKHKEANSGFWIFLQVQWEYISELLQV